MSSTRSAALAALSLTLYLYLCCALVDAQTSPICNLKSSPSSISYNLANPPLGTQKNGITDLPTPFYGAYINFCQPAQQCNGAYACLIGPTFNLSLCTAPPQGQFINSQYPQLGATYSCPVVKGLDGKNYQLNGVITCGPSDIPGIGFAALYTVPAAGAAIGIDFVNPVRKYCNNSGTPA